MNDDDPSVLMFTVDAAAELFSAVNSFDEVSKSESSTAWEVGRAFGAWMNALADFQLEIGEGYQEAVEAAAENRYSEGFVGEYLVGREAVGAAAAEGLVQTGWAISAGLFRITGETIEAIFAVEKTTVAAEQLAKGDFNAALHTLVDVTADIADALLDVAGKGVAAGVGHVVVEALTGIGETAFEATEATREIVGAAIDEIRGGQNVELLSGLAKAESTPNVYTIDVDLTPNSHQTELILMDPDVIYTNKRIDTEFTPAPDEVTGEEDSSGGGTFNMEEDPGGGGTFNMEDEQMSTVQTGAPAPAWDAMASADGADNSRDESVAPGWDAASDEGNGDQGNGDQGNGDQGYAGGTNGDAGSGGGDDGNDGDDG